jgi:small subunit ribosomal protein S16
MALKIRLARGGAKKRPFYRIVVAEAGCPRDGRFVERVGSYNPLLPHDHADRIVLNVERIKHWLSVGAQPTDRVELFLGNAGLVGKKERRADPQKSAPKKRAQERLKAEEEARAKAAEKAAEPVVEAAPVEAAAETPAAE